MNWSFLEWELVYAVDTPEVVILKHVREDPRTAVRLERMLPCISADRVSEVDWAGFAELVKDRGWSWYDKRTGQYRMTRAPAIIFNTFRWLTPQEFEELGKQYPVLRADAFLGRGAWELREAADARHDRCVCQSAYEIHCAFGCLHACDYCHVAPFFNIMLNLEELAEHIREFGETIPRQSLYKFDNQTDTVTMEPEYGASEVMVRMFADWPGRYLMLYTKSDNVEHLLGLPHKGKTIVCWSISSKTASRVIEKNTPPLDRRIRAIERCQAAGYPVRVRLSPICPLKNWREENRDMVRRLLKRARPDVISIDVVGWMTPQKMKDAMDTSLWDERYVAELDRLIAEGFQPKGKHVFPHEMRAEILRSVIEEVRRIRPEQPVSLCMETQEMWEELGPLTGMTPVDYACCCGPACVPGHPLLATASKQ